jgi:hypothetical protein
MMSERENVEKNDWGIILIIFLLVLSSFFLFFGNVISTYKINKNNPSYEDNVNLSGSLDFVVNLTNFQLNNTRHYHNSILKIEGRVYEPTSPSNSGSGVNIAIVINSIMDETYSNITDTNGEFEIYYQIPELLNVYSEHKIEADSIDNPDIEPNNYFMINVSANSHIDVSYIDSPYLPGEEFDLTGYLKYNDQNGNGISNAPITYYWTNGTFDWSSDSFSTASTDGSISESLFLPSNPHSAQLFLNLSYMGDFPNINSTNILIGPFDIFHNISCTWNIINETSEGQDYTIRGQIWAKNNPSLKIYNRRANFYYEGEGLIGGTTTDSNGNFTFSYSIPSGTGNRTISVQLVNIAGVFLSNQTLIFITVSNPVLPNPLIITPFQWFFIIGIPIIIGVIAALGIYGYLYYKKEISASRLVNIPLEGKIRNLKILKDSGRIEEALSYLFNAIYVELVAAKFGRKRNANETIRDFAIISVQDFRLDPAKIYPFIQKIEQIIYAQPFKITEEEFYKTIELFSPVYYQLTGYNFVLNF